MKTPLKSYSSKILLKRMETREGAELAEIKEILIGRGIIQEEDVKLSKAKTHIGKKVHFFRKKTKEDLTGVIQNVRLDPRSNLIQYLIKTDKGLFGKSIISKDLKFV